MVLIDYRFPLRSRKGMGNFYGWTYSKTGRRIRSVIPLDAHVTRNRRFRLSEFLATIDHETAHALSTYVNSHRYNGKSNVREELMAVAFEMAGEWARRDG